MAGYICTQCGWEGERKKELRGSRMVETLLWSVLLLPGPLYSIWRRTGRSKQCPHCGVPMLVKLTSDAGWLARRRFDVELGLIKIPPVPDRPATPVSFGGGKGPEVKQETKKPVDPDRW